MKIRISAEAADLYQREVNKVGGAGVRVFLRRSGCHGFTYVADVQRELASDEVVVLSSGVTFYVPMKDARYVDGLIIDLVTEGLQKMIRFSHPGIVGACGCGASVTFEEKKKE